MLNKMSEAQRSMLQAGAAREDRLLQPPGTARGAVTKSLAARLIDAGLAREIKASNGVPVWRRDPATGAAYALKLTAKGLKAVAVANDGPDRSETSPLPTAGETASPSAPAQESALSVSAQVVTIDSNSSVVASTTTTRPPRSGSKLRDVLARLSTEAGATVGELSAATCWMEHTTRAALTGLRQRGYTLNLTKHERDGASVYRISGNGGGSTQ